MPSPIHRRDLRDVGFYLRLTVCFVIALMLAPYHLAYSVAVGLFEFVLEVYLRHRGRLEEAGPNDLLRRMRRGAFGFGAVSGEFNRLLIYLLRRISRRLGEPRARGRSPFTASSFVIALQLSVLYPFVLILADFASGDGVRMANISVLTGVPVAMIVRYPTIVLLGTAFCAVVFRVVSRFRRRLVRRPLQGVVLLVTGLYLVVLGLGLQTNLMTEFGLDASLLILPTIMFAAQLFRVVGQLKSPAFILFTFMPTFAGMASLVALPFVARSIAIAIGLIFFAPKVWDRQRLGWLYVGLLICAMIAPQLITIVIDSPVDSIYFYAERVDGHINAAFVVLVLGLLPVINAITNWVGFNCTRLLLARVAQKPMTQRRAQAYFVANLAIGVLLCGLFMGILAALLHFIEIQLVSQPVQQEGLRLDVPLLKEQLYGVFFRPYDFWLLGMLLTCLLPSACCIAMVWVASTFTVLPFRKHAERALQAMINAGDTGSLRPGRARWAAMWLTASTLVSTLITLSVISLIVALVIAAGSIGVPKLLGAP